jgi:rubrerythrin
MSRLHSFTETADNEKEHAQRFFKFLEGGEVSITALSGGCDWYDRRKLAGGRQW